MKGSKFFVLGILLTTMMLSCSSPSVPEQTLPAPTSTEISSPAPTQTSRPTSSPTLSPTPTFTLTPIPPTPTPTPSSTPAPKTVAIELGEVELAEGYKSWIKDAGLSIEAVEVELANDRMEVLMKNVGIPVYMIEEFKMIGTYIVVDGELKFQLEEVAPDAPWVWVITPTADDVMAEMIEGIYVTEVEIVDGSLIVKGLEAES